MKKDSTPSGEGKLCSVSPVYRVGDTIIFKFEGNIRATVEGCEIIDGGVWLATGSGRRSSSSRRARGEI